MALGSGVSSLSGTTEEIVKRGWFAVRAMKRIAKAPNKMKQFETEKRYFQAHQQAAINRQKVRQLMEANRKFFGDIGGWYLGPNENHCPICVGAAGNNFRFARPPLIGYPGSAHPNCNCSAGAPFPGAITLP